MARATSLLALGLLLSFSGAATAAAAKTGQACTAADIAPLARYLKLPRLSLAANGPISDSACKKLPNNPLLGVTALVYVDKAASDDASLKQRAVALINSADGKVVGIYQDDVSEDEGTKVEAGSLWIDTAAYQLTDKVRAFGIRFDADHFGGCYCCAEAGTGPRLSLFVPAAGNSLSQVLADLPTTMWQNVKCDASNNSAPRIIESAAITIAPATSQTKGYADLVISASSKLGVQGGAMAPNPKRKPLQFTVRFNGKAYDLAKYKLAFDQWWR